MPTTTISNVNTDDEIQAVIDALDNDLTTCANDYRSVFEKLELRNGILYLAEGKRKRFVLPKQIREDEIKRQHEEFGHQATDKLHKRLRKRLYWPKMRESIERVVNQCETCLRTQEHGAAQIDLGHLNASRPFELISIDVVGPLPISSRQNRFIIAATDYFSKWVVAAAYKNFNAKTTAKFLVEEIFLKFGPPQTILSDQGTNFESELVRELLDYFNVKKKEVNALSSGRKWRCRA